MKKSNHFPWCWPSIFYLRKSRQGWILRASDIKFWSSKPKKGEVKAYSPWTHWFYWGSAIFAVVLKYNNLFLPFTFFLYCFHFALCYKLIVCPKTTAFMRHKVCTMAAMKSGVQSKKENEIIRWAYESVFY